MTGSYKHNRSKQRLMLYFFRVYHNCNDKVHFKSSMDMRMELIGHMEVGLLIDTGRIDLIQ